METRTELVQTEGADFYCCSEDGKYRYLYSQDKKYRYWLEAKLYEKPEKPGAILFIMLNPGTEAGEERKNHVTRKNCERFAGEQRYGTLWTCNLFAFRAAESDAIKDESHIGENNDSYTLRYSHQANMIVRAWGEGKGRSKDKRYRRDRSRIVLQMLKDNGLLCRTFHLGLTKTNSQPRHPMVLPLNTQPTPYRPPLR